MYAVLGEGPSDAETLKVLVRRLAGDETLPVLARGFKGGPSLLRDGAKAIGALWTQGARRFVICHDADGPDPIPIGRMLRERVLARLAGTPVHCLVVPVHEIEAWFLADPASINAVVRGFEPPRVARPEGLADPKKHLERVARRAGKRYNASLHNAAFARRLDLDAAYEHCPSFRPLADFVRGSASSASA